MIPAPDATSPASQVGGDHGSFSQEAKIPTCSPEFARLVLPSVYRALDCIVSPTGGIAQERLEYVAAILEKARDEPVPCFEYGSTARIGTACKPCNPEITDLGFGMGAR